MDKPTKKDKRKCKGVEYTFMRIALLIYKTNMRYNKEGPLKGLLSAEKRAHLHDRSFETVQLKVLDEYYSESENNSESS